MKKYLFANWKENHDLSSAILYCRAWEEYIQKYQKKEVESCLFPPFPFIGLLKEKFPSLTLGAQNVSHFEKGAYTGEVSAGMLKSCGVNYVIIGHSERRQIFGENSGLLKNKIQLSLQNQLIPVYCIGESLEQRENGKHLDVVKNQIEEVLENIETAFLIIAYEPVWAIGTGKTANTDQIREMHEFIYRIIEKNFGHQWPVLYGGSVNQHNIAEILSVPCVDGALVGSASLQVTGFIEMYKQL